VQDLPGAKVVKIYGLPNKNEKIMERNPTFAWQLI
jgi:hypothetical protein